MKLSKVAMKRLVLLALAIACLVPAMPAAAEPGRPSRTEALAALKKSDAEERRRGALGLAIVGRMEDAPTLITALRDADERVRAVAEQALWAVWSRSGNARVDDLLSRGVAEMGEQRFPEAIATFTRIIELKPGFAEGWNKRATAYFLAGEFRRSLMDCDEVIKRNPQHFGVLSGYGQIYLRLDQPEKALEYFRRALAVNPNLEGVQGLAERLDSMIVRRRPVDTRFDLRVEGEPHSVRGGNHAERHVVAQAVRIEVAEDLAPVEMLVGFLGRLPMRAPVARRARGRHSVHEAEALHQAEGPARPRPDHRRIEHHDRTEQLRPLQRGKHGEIAAERMPHAEHRFPVALDMLELFR